MNASRLVILILAVILALCGTTDASAKSIPALSKETRLVPYLKAVKMESSKEARKALAESLGIAGYDFSAGKNAELLAAVKAIKAKEMLSKETRLVPYLEGMKMRSSKEARKALAAEHNVKGYDFSVGKNAELLAAIKNSENQEERPAAQPVPLTKPADSQFLKTPMPAPAASSVEPAKVPAPITAVEPTEALPAPEVQPAQTVATALPLIAPQPQTVEEIIAENLAKEPLMTGSAPIAPVMPEAAPEGTIPPVPAAPTLIKVEKTDKELIDDAMRSFTETFQKNVEPPPAYKAPEEAEVRDVTWTITGITILLFGFVMLGSILIARRVKKAKDKPPAQPLQKPKIDLPARPEANPVKKESARIAQLRQRSIEFAFHDDNLSSLINLRDQFTPEDKALIKRLALTHPDGGNIIKTLQIA